MLIFCGGISYGGTYLVPKTNFILILIFLTHAWWYFGEIEQVEQSFPIQSHWYYTYRKEPKYLHHNFDKSIFIS
jgi:hypothetical protein